MDRIKNPNEIKYLKVPTYVFGLHMVSVFRVIMSKRWMAKNHAS
jgi:hypothetical protein